MERSKPLLLGIALAVGVATTTPAAPPRPTVATQKPPLVATPHTVPLYTDLALSNVWTDPQTCRLWVSWENKGTRSIDATLKERIEVYSQPERTDEGMNHVVLAPGQSFSHGVGADPGVVISGATEVRAQIDVDNVLGETGARRGNNSIYRTVTCGRSMPDLYPSTIQFTVKMTATDAQGHTCKVLRVKPVILNIGSAPARGPFEVKVEADSGAGRSWVTYHTATVDSMAVGQRRVLDGFEIDTCFWFIHNPTMLPNDVRRFRLTVDTTNAVHESQEDNNQGVIAY